MSRAVQTDLHDGLLRITLSRPEAGNAVVPATIDGLDEAMALAGGADVRVVLLDAAGRNFCVGADLRHLGGSGELAAELDGMAGRFHAMLIRLISLEIPVVAAVQGNAVGAGFGLVLSADVVVADPSARLTTGYAKLGLSADAGVSYFLTRAVGPRMARSLLITSRSIDAQSAERLGLVDEVVGAGDLDRRASEIAASLAAGPTAAFAAVKRLVSEASAGNTLAEHLGLEQGEIVALAGSESVTGAIKAILER
jgi:2-(1,2-epoxy-1,2-dihydrophenyl)acetyl-CoA isomerase